MIMIEICCVYVYVSLSVFVCAPSFCVLVHVSVCECQKKMGCIHIYTFVKCTCLHTRHGNGDIQYTLGGVVLSTTIKRT